MSEEDINSEVEVLYGLIRVKYSKNLTHNELLKVKEKIEQIVRVAYEVRAISIDVNVDPSTIFRPHRGEC